MQDNHLHPLLEAYLENRLTAAEASELRTLLRSSPFARQRFWEYVEQHALLEDILTEARGMDLALLQRDESLAALASGQGEPAQSVTPGPASPRRLLGLGALMALAAGLLLAIVLWSRPGTGTDPDSETAPFATIHAVAGDVRVGDPSGYAIPAVPGSALRAGQFLAVGADEDSRAEVLLADGSQVTLSPSSTLRFVAEQLSQGKRIHLETGAARVEAAPQPVDLPLVVTTDHARITAHQTRFRLYREQQASRVELEEGKLLLESQTGERQLELTQGLYVVATAEPQPMVTHPMPSGHCRLLHTLLKAGDAASFSLDGRQLLTSHFSRGLKLWAVEDGKLQASAPGSGQRAVGLAFADETTMMALGDRGTALLWNVREPQATSTRLREKDLRCAAISADGRWLAQGWRSEVVVWETNRETGTISLRRTLPLKPSRLALASVGAPRVAVSKWAGDILVFDVASGRELARHKLKRTPTPLALSADGRYLAAYANEDGLVLFDQQTSERYTLWPGEGARVACLTYSADGRILLAGLDDGTVRAWSVSDASSLLVLDTGHRHVNKVTVTADRSLLATVGDNDCVKIWEIVLR